MTRISQSFPNPGLTGLMNAREQLVEEPEHLLWQNWTPVIS